MKLLILAGGGGTRLYPLSNPASPKQFLPLADEKPLIINTIERFLSVCSMSDMVVVTGEKYRDLTTKCLREYGYQEVNVVYEPCAKNTAPAIMLGIRFMTDILKMPESEPIFVAPSDHVIEPLDSYLNTVKVVLNETERGKVVTVGIVPKSPDTGFGYILAENNSAAAKKVLAFKEKPDLQTAKTYLENGNYYWNAGMYAFTPAVLESELKAYALDLYASYIKSFQGLTDSFSELSGISIDYAIAEKSKNISVVPFSGTWSDIGSWDAYYDFCHKDATGNVVIGNVRHMGCKNCLLLAHSGNLTVFNQVDMFVIGANGNCICLPRGKSQLVKGS